jgi:hypothetical protein
VLAVVEDHVAEDNVALEVLPLMATALETAQIIYLSMCLRRALSGDEVRHRQLAVFPLTL